MRKAEYNGQQLVKKMDQEKKRKKRKQKEICCFITRNRRQKYCKIIEFQPAVNGNNSYK